MTTFTASAETAQQPDLVVRNATVFDGSGAAPRIIDVAVTGNKISAVGSSLPAGKQEVDAAGQWLTPGLWDIHTHLDLEVELDPGLTEVVRHGTTSAVVANCSIGLAFGRQNKDGHEPVVSCFARVENVPKPVLRRVAEKIDWDSPKGYLKHFSEIPLGANVLPMIPHSMLRIEAMGLENCISRPPNENELSKMEQLLDDAMAAGYAGFSTDALPFHYLSDDPHRQIKIPTHNASFPELKRLTTIVRDHDRVWQATPPKDSPLQVARTFLLSSGRLFGKPLKTTAVAALDVATNRNLARMGVTLMRVINSKLLNGRFHLQALAAPFRIYADGLITPIAEEIPVMRELNEIDLEDRPARIALLNDQAFQQRFKTMWYADKRGFSPKQLIGQLKRKLKIMDDSLSRDLNDMVMSERPLPGWKNQTLGQIYSRYLRRSKGGASLSHAEEQLFTRLDTNAATAISDDCDFLLALLREFDTDLRWYTMVANDREAKREALLFNPQTLPGFNDSGAHITNMAYFDGNLRGLQLAQQRSLAAVASLVHRLTAVPAAFFGVEGVGEVAVGQRADLILINPEKLKHYNSEASTILEQRDILGHEQMLNRSDNIVSHSWINGQLAWQNNAPSELLGKQRLGSALTAGPINDSLPQQPLPAAA